MANPEHVALLQEGAEAIEEWRRENPEEQLDLGEAKLRKVNLSSANLSKANLVEADLREADLSWVNLNEADLSDADLYRADLSGADLLGAKLVGADLFQADLSQTNLSFCNFSMAGLSEARLIAANLSFASLLRCNLRGATLSRANLTRTSFTEAVLGGTSVNTCDLNQCTGLAAATHDGPSGIGTDTLVASFRGAGNCLTEDLERFFRAAGVPGELLAALPDVVENIRYHTCLISYTQPDRSFAETLQRDLIAHGASCWLFAADHTPQERTRTGIVQRRQTAERVILLCSLAALAQDGFLNEIEDRMEEDDDSIAVVSLNQLWDHYGKLVMRSGRDLAPFLKDRSYADFGDSTPYEESLTDLLQRLERGDKLG